MSIDYLQAKVVTILPIIILDSVQINSTVCDPCCQIASRALYSLHGSLPVPHIAAASLGSVVQTHRNGKLVKATKLAVRNLDRVRKEQKRNVSLSHMNLKVKEDNQDEKTLFS